MSLYLYTFTAPIRIMHKGQMSQSFLYILFRYHFYSYPICANVFMYTMKGRKRERKKKHHQEI